MTDSEWINLPELNMHVDAIVESLVRAAWSRGVRISFGSGGNGNSGPASVGFPDMQSAFRWKRLTGCDLEEGDDDFGTALESSFAVHEISTIVEHLQDLTNAGTWSPDHEQVDLPDLGFSVDRGLEELIRACWRRGIATSVSCIGTGDSTERPHAGYVGFYEAQDAGRWSAITGLECHWIPDLEVATEAEYYFTAEGIPDLIERLKTI